MILLKLIYFAVLASSEVQGRSTTAFVIDKTYSMGEKLDMVKYVAKKIADIYDEIDVIKKYTIVEVDDPEVKIKSVVMVSRDVFNQRLNTIEATGSNLDCPEPSLFGVEQAITLNEPKSDIYVFTDGLPKDFYRLKKIKELCYEYESRITFLILGHCLQDPNEFWAYFSIAKECSGNVLIISKDEMLEVPAYIKETIFVPKILFKNNAPANRLTDIEFEVKNRTQYVIASASGRNVRLYSSSPKWSQKQLIWTENFKAIKINRPVSGIHTVSVIGESIAIDVDITAYDDSNTRNKVISKTMETLNTTPKLDIVTTDKEEYLKTKYDIRTNFIEETESINNKDKSELVENKKLEQDTKVKTEIESILKEVNEGFQAPRVAISEGREIEVHPGDTVLLTCKVTGNPEPEITWTDDSGSILLFSTLSLFPPYYYVSFLKLTVEAEVSLYHCEASNSFGNDTKLIKVVTNDNPISENDKIYCECADSMPTFFNSSVVN